MTLERMDEVASIVMAAGRGSRMKGYEGNKTLLPLVPDGPPYKGTRPMLLHILQCLPPGPKAVVVHHEKEAVIRATQGLGIAYVEQPELNGTGGALLAARRFVEGLGTAPVIITMGDVPLVQRATYLKLVGELALGDLVILGFRPADKKQYGVLELDGDRVRRVIEWKYWREYPPARRSALSICNSGIYATRKERLLHYLGVLASRPHRVQKEVGGVPRVIEEFFVTDLVEYMDADGLNVRYVVTEDEAEVMGVDDPVALTKAQEAYRRARGLR
jgi:bifunctional UDP-N-acetylglucosamine pyrophosphorylase/glucosamine-1-phosphate N-acetyltransferase